MGKKMFDFVIGNPPYQEEVKKTSDRPVYHYFMDAAYQCADKVELITPGRFLFNAGKTPKKWNQKRLSDPHFKVLEYIADSSTVFSDTDIKGGVAITYRDATKDFGAVEVFVAHERLRSILSKVKNKQEASLSEWVYAPESYKLTEKLHTDYPEAEHLLSAGHKYDVTTNIFDKLPFIFFDEVENEDQYVKLYGREKNQRVEKYIKKEYLAYPDNFYFYKVILPKSNGSGALGEVLSTPILGTPILGHTQTFISIGKFVTKEEGQACLKYIKTKFARAMLGVLKVTQDNKKAVWQYVPLQDFTDQSDIDWSKSIADIDRQLYRKYGLDEEEVQFIEQHVKEMA